VRRKELSPRRRRAVFLGEQGEQRIADFELFDYGAEASLRVSKCCTQLQFCVEMTRNLPVAATFVQQARLQLFQIFLTKLAQSRIHQHRHPRHDRRDLAIAVHWQAVAQLK
jgi:hypothetical protein